jgi:hypothetical protein
VPAQQEQSPEGSVVSDPFSPKSPTILVPPSETTPDKAAAPANGAGNDHAPLSVEEAVQKVSLR